MTILTMLNKGSYVVLVCLFLVLSGRNCEARRDILGDLFSFLEFDARTVTVPVAIASKTPTIVVPQYRSQEPIFIQPKYGPVPQIMINGITPYSSLPNPYLSHLAKRRLSRRSIYPRQPRISLIDRLFKSKRR